MQVLAALSRKRQGRMNLGHHGGICAYSGRDALRRAGPRSPILLPGFDLTAFRDPRPLGSVNQVMAPAPCFPE
jgi:hypothetical protein